MFASQLLRILQTIPSDVKKDDNRESGFDPDQSDTTMKETQHVTNGDSKSLRRESSDNNIAFGSKEIYRFDSSGRRTNPFLFESNWNPRFANEFPVENGNRESKFTGKSNSRNGMLKDDGHVIERAQIMPVDETPMDVEGDESRDNKSIHSWLRTLSTEANGKGKAKSVEGRCKEESRDRWSSSSSLSTEANSLDRKISVQVVELKHQEDVSAAPVMFQRDTFLFGEKDDAIECDIPELLVCYKEINYHIMEEKFSDDDDDDNSHPKSTETGADFEVSALSDELALSSSDITNDITANLQSRSLFEEDSNEFDHSTKEELQITGENNSISTGESLDKITEDVSLVDQKLPIQEFGTRSFLRSFLHSLDDHKASNDIQLDDQISPRKEATENREDLATKEEPKENGEMNSLCYESEVENGSITFKFSSSSPIISAAHIINQISDRLKDKSESMLKPKDSLEGNNNPPRHNQVHCKRNAVVDSQESSIKKIVENNHHLPFEPKNKNPDDHVQLSKTQNQESIICQDAKNVETNSLRQHEHRKSCQESVVIKEKDAHTLVTYSGPIEHNGSQSIRSDGSATSTRSFAFPILQCEWDDSSPTRMGFKADGRHLRKQKNSRSGLFCCGF